MMQLRQILQILKFEVKKDLRTNNQFLAAILYLTGITFIVFRLFGEIRPAMRIGFFWIILLFTSIVLISHSFGSQANNRKLMHYQIYDGLTFYLALYIINSLKLIAAALVLLLLFLVFGGEELKDPWLFCKALLLSCFGIVAVLNLISSMSIYSNNQTSLISILSMPLIIPVLMLGLKVSLVAEKMFFDSSVGDSLLLLLGIDLLLIALGSFFASVTWKS